MAKTKKIRCKTCVNAQDFFCVVKNIEIRPSKKHRCKKYVSNLPTKVPVKMDYHEQEKVRQKYKQELVELKHLMKSRAARGLDRRMDEKYPLTGNLDRFK